MPIAYAIETAAINAIAAERLEAVGNLHRAGEIRVEFLRAAFTHWGIEALFTTDYPAETMRLLFENWYDINITRGTPYSLGLFAGTVGAAYSLTWTENANGRRVSVVANLFMLVRGGPTADQRSYIIDGFRWLMGTRVAVSAIQIVERTEFPLFIAMPNRTNKITDLRDRTAWISA